MEKENSQLDITDIRIIKELNKDGRISFAT